jgi:hypothetical protein
MRLFLLDLVRRTHRWIPLMMAAALVAIWSIPEDQAQLGMAFAYSMGTAFMIGPQLMTPLLVPRAIWYLPISRRDVWRATWLLATVGATTMTTLAKLLAMVMPWSEGSFSLATLLLSGLYDFGYAGLGCAVIIVATWPRPSGGPGHLVWPLFKGAADFTLPLGMAAGFFGGRFIGHVLPVHWSEITVRTGAVLAAALGVTVASYFHSAVPLTPANRTAGRHVEARTRRFEPGGLAGLPRLLVHEYAWTLMIGGVLVIGSALVAAVAAGYLQSSESLIGLLRSVLLHVDGSAPPVPGRGLQTFIFLIGFAILAASLSGRFPDMLRHLRVLPLGAARLNALLVAWPAVAWLTAWTGFLALHYLVMGRGVASYHADALLFLAGVSAIAQAVTLRLSLAIRVFTFVFPLGFILGVGPSLPWLLAPRSAVFATTGLACLAAAAALNHRSFARKSTYIPIGPALGVVAPPPR